MKRFLSTLDSGSGIDPTPTSVVVCIAIAALAGQLVLHAATDMPWWGGVIVVVPVNAIVGAIMVWLDRAAAMRDPIASALETSRKRALLLIAFYGILYYLINFAVDAFRGLIDASYNFQFSMLHLWLVLTFTSAIVVVMSRRRAAAIYV